MWMQRGEEIVYSRAAQKDRDPNQYSPKYSRLFSLSKLGLANLGQQMTEAIFLTSGAARSLSRRTCVMPSFFELSLTPGRES